MKKFLYTVVVTCFLLATWNIVAQGSYLSCGVEMGVAYAAMCMLERLHDTEGEGD